MSRFIRVALVFFIVVIAFQAQAQDPHFSQYNAVPQNLNPAMTGVFSGNYRLTAIYRNQWQSVLSQDSPQGVPYFRTFAGAADFRIPVGGRKGKDAIGFGINFLTDKAGALSFGTNQVYINLSYIKALGSKYNNRPEHFLSGGFQGGVGTRGVDYTNARFGNQFDGERFVETINPGEVTGDDSFLFFDIGVGVFYYYVPEKRKNFYFGAAIAHINRPNMSFVDGDNAKLFMRTSVNGGAQFQIATQVDLLPSFIIMNQGPSIETMLGVQAKILFQSADPAGNAFYIGPYYRFVRGDKNFGGAIGSDALILATRIDVSSFSVGFSYDLNFSELTDASNANGGFEVSLAYIGNWGSKSKAHFCPRF